MENKKSYKVNGGSILIFGDLHLSCVYNGQHKMYSEECLWNMKNIGNIVKSKNPSAVFFLGDIIGVNERNIRDRRFLLNIHLFFEYLNRVTEGNVYTVKGNHDIGDFSDFDYLEGLGLIKNPNYVDYYDPEGKALEVRFHFINYGEEFRHITLPEDSEISSNVVLGHSDYKIQGVTNWYMTKDGHEVSSLKNLKGVELIISGHIHNPSEGVVFTRIDGRDIGLFYVGSCSRTAERFDDCWYMEFKYITEEGYSEYEAHLMNLMKADEVFYPKENFLDEDADKGMTGDVNSETLTNIVKEIMEDRLTSGNLFDQIRIIPGVSDKVKDLACSYLRKAIDG